MKGQLSAEMLILIAVILAIVAIAANQMIGTAKSTSSNIGNQTDHINEMTKEAIKSPRGGYCFTDDDCESSLSCDLADKVCG
jgi:hypothetical protein